MLQTRRETVEEHNGLKSTASGQGVERELYEAKKKLDGNIGEIENEHRKAMEAQDDELAEILQTQLREWKDKLQQATKD